MKPHPTVGKEYGNYVVRGLLGEGGMGAVFAAEHKFLGDHVAIKILHGTYAQNRSVTERFFLEAKATRDISHPNVIKIFDFGMAEDGGLYLVMELLEGRTLTSFLQAGRPEEKVLARIGAEIADGLAAAHEKGIIHRDLKPDNIFLVCDGLKILDFGIAKVLTSSGGNGPAKTGTGALLGTPRYMAPEQAKGAKFVGPHSDTYSLGVILFEMVTGRAPFEAGDLAELLTKILLEPAPRPSEFAPVSPELEELIVSCLAKDPAARPSGMDEVRERLGKLAGGASIGALSEVRVKEWSVAGLVVGPRGDSDGNRRDGDPSERGRRANRRAKSGARGGDCFGDCHGRSGGVHRSAAAVPAGDRARFAVGRRSEVAEEDAWEPAGEIWQSVDCQQASRRSCREHRGGVGSSRSRSRSRFGDGHHPVRAAGSKRRGR